MELINTVWEVPNRYQDLMPVGTGAFGQVNVLSRVGNEPSRSLKFHNHGDGPYLAFSLLKVPRAFTFTLLHAFKTHGTTT